MSMNDQRGKTAQPVMPGGAVPGTAVTLPTELAHVEPTKIDEETQQGANTLFFFFRSVHALLAVFTFTSNPEECRDK